MRSTSGAALAAVILAMAGCSGIPEKNNGSGPMGGDVSGQVRSAPIPGNGLSAEDRAVLRDPQGLLSKRSVYFDYDDFRIRADQRSLVEAHSRFLASRRSVRVVLEGHADERGSHEYNLALGQRRAEALQRVMKVLGVTDAQIEAVSFGEEKPVATGHDEASQAQNRRAVIRYVDE